MVYVFGFVHPATGRNLQLLLPRVDTDVMSIALEHFSRNRSRTVRLTPAARQTHFIANR